MRRIASLAETYDVALAPHCPLGPIALAACMQVGLASPNCTYLITLFFLNRFGYLKCLNFLSPYAVVIQECSWEMHYNVGADLYTYVKSSSLSVFAVKDGYIEAPTAPGLGFEVDEEKVRSMDELRQRKSINELDMGKEGTKAWRNAMFTGPDGALREW